MLGEPVTGTPSSRANVAAGERRGGSWQLVEWLGIRARLPSDWEIVRHAVSLRNGSLVFIDRRRQRLTLSWTECRHEPDLVRLVRDYGARCLASSSFEPCEGVGCWRGLVETRPDGERVARVVTYEPRSARLLEAMLLVAAGDDAERAIVPLLERMEVVAADGALRRFSAFGLRARAPAGMQLAHVAVQPAKLVVEFRDAADGGRGAVAAVQRLGMAEAWFGGDLEGALRRREPGVRFTSFETTEYAGWPALLGAGKQAVTPFARLARRARHAHCLAWHCESENAVYVVSCGTRGEDDVLPADLNVACERRGVDGS